MMESYMFLGFNLYAWITIITVLTMFTVLLFTKLRSDLVFLGAIAIIFVTGVLDTKEAFSGFSSTSVVVIGVLFVVVAGLMHTGVLQWIVKNLLGQPKTYTKAVVRLMLPVAGLSSFLSNTTVVALFVGIVKMWSKKLGISWLQIPYYDREGKLVGVQNRNLNYHRSDSEGQFSIVNSQFSISQPRFRFPRGSQCGIYNLPVLNLLKPGEELYITEGCSDCWAMLSAGHKAIAIPSATLLSKNDIDQLSILNYQLSIQFHMYPDRDVPGERLFLQLQQVLPNLVHHQLPLGCKDFGEYYVKRLKMED